MLKRSSQRYAAILISSAALLAGCNSGDPVYSSFGNEAGSMLDTGTFGNATMNNVQMMNGEKQYAYDLSSRFASEVLTTVNFAFGSFDLDAGARDTLREQAAWIRQFPEVRFRVYGHADAVGSNGANKALGLRRAHAVVNYLATQGIGKSRLEAVSSFGEEQPLIVTEGRERRNRRTVTEVSGFVGSHPMIMDGKYAQVVYREYVASGTAVSAVNPRTPN
ncbi:OmpA family protein [Planktotalea arctica]|uniref:OmpA family protein n=1 Tax=Planktotalea arctica TaxID=1481893 RepID=UPI000A1751EB|nr:OmpA family protein [Planktotalea arctica]